MTDLAEQVEEERWVREAAACGAQEEPPAEPVKSAVVAVASGEGVKRIFRSLGARQIVAGGQSANPSTEEILAGDRRGARRSRWWYCPTTATSWPRPSKPPTTRPRRCAWCRPPAFPEGFAALLAYDPEADVDTNADNMAAAAKRVVAGEVAQASRHAVPSAGRGEGGRLARDVP